jgi:hypothetical protein
MNFGGPHRPAEATDPPDGRMPAEWMIVQEFSGLIPVSHRVAALPVDPVAAAPATCSAAHR